MSELVADAARTRAADLAAYVVAVGDLPFALLLDAAHAAHDPALVVVDVLRCTRVSLEAVPLDDGALARSVSAESYRLEVGGANARGVEADVVNDEAVGDWPDEEFICEAVSLMVLTAMVEPPVPEFVLPTLPDPASIADEKTV